MLIERSGNIGAETPTIQKPFTQEQAVALIARLLAEAPMQAPLVETRAGGETRETPVVLLVEDNAVARSAIEELLSELGHEVLAAGTVARAQALVEARGSVDLVLSDIRLPDGAGPELFEQLRNTHPRVCAIYISGMQRNAEIDAIVARHGADFVQKPADFSTLTCAIRRQLETD
jgi:DNA-binding NtrC family response regulator